MNVDFRERRMEGKQMKIMLGIGIFEDLKGAFVETNTMAENIT